MAVFVDGLRFYTLTRTLPGIGTKLLDGMIFESEASGKFLSIHVERFNPALRLYERLGFEKVVDKGVYFLLQRPPDAAS